MSVFCSPLRRSDNIAGLIPRGLGKSKQLVITEMHSFAFLRGRGTERSPVTGGGGGAGILVILFVLLDPLFFPGDYLLRTLLLELPCWLATIGFGTGRK